MWENCILSLTNLRGFKTSWRSVFVRPLFHMGLCKDDTHEIWYRLSEKPTQWKSFRIVEAEQGSQPIDLGLPKRLKYGFLTIQKRTWAKNLICLLHLFVNRLRFILTRYCLNCQRWFVWVGRGKWQPFQIIGSQLLREYVWELSVSFREKSGNIHWSNKHVCFAMKLNIHINAESFPTSYVGT